jgi:hypothetical protein
MPGIGSLYRTVQRDELEDIRDSGQLRTTSATLEVKLLWTSRTDAERFGRLLGRQGIGPSWVVEVRAPTIILEQLPALTMDGRPTRVVEQGRLAWFNEHVEVLLPEKRET